MISPILPSCVVCLYTTPNHYTAFTIFPSTWGLRGRGGAERLAGLGRRPLQHQLSLVPQQQQRSSCTVAYCCFSCVCLTLADSTPPPESSVTDEDYNNGRGRDNEDDVITVEGGLRGKRFSIITTPRGQSWTGKGDTHSKRKNEGGPYFRKKY